MQKTKKLLAASVISVAALLLAVTSFAPFAKAQQAQGGSGLSISPTVSQLTVKPGGSDNVKITLKNVTTDDVVAKAEVDDFTSNNVDGNPKIITNQTQTTPNSIRKFVTNLDNVSLAKGEQKQVVLDVEVPKDTPAGAYYGIIRYRAVPSVLAQPGAGQVSLTASVGTIVLVTVPGNLREQVQAKGIHVYRGTREGTFFVRPPDKIGITIQNFGNGFEQPFGTIEVHNTFNKTVTSFAFNNPKELGNVLPNSSRTFTNSVKGINKIGRYTVLASVSYGNGSQVLTLKKEFWYIPYWLVITVVLVLAALIFLAVRSYRQYTRSGRRSRR